MRFFQKSFVLFLFALLTAPLLYAESIQVGCSNWKPFFYSENDKIMGSGYEIAKAVVNKAGIDAEFNVGPWKRVYVTGLEKPNYMIACLGRTPKREKLFHWIGPITKGKSYNLYKLSSSSATLGSVQELLNYKVGVLRGGHQHDFLKGLSHSNIHEVARADLLVKILNGGRVDFILSTDVEVKNDSAAANIPEGKIVKALEAYEVAANLAFGKMTSDNLVQSAQNAYQALAGEGKITLK